MMMKLSMSVVVGVFVCIVFFLFCLRDELLFGECY